MSVYAGDAFKIGTFGSVQRFCLSILFVCNFYLADLVMAGGSSNFRL